MVLKYREVSSVSTPGAGGPGTVRLNSSPVEHGDCVLLNHKVVSGTGWKSNRLCLRQCH